MNTFYVLMFLITICTLNVLSLERYEPTWASLDTRPLPEWYDKLKIGIFIHWGVFSVPSFGSEWFWKYWKGYHYPEYVNFINENFPPDFSYQEFAKEFTAEFFNASAWADLFVKSGAKYVVLTSKHHEGFTLWPSKYSYSWNALDIGPHRDIVNELSVAVRQKNLTYGLYHSMFEWFNPMFLLDERNNFKTQEFVEKKYLPELYELIETYKPSILWTDGDGGANDTYWNATEFLAWLYNDSPVKNYIVVNDRWGNGINCNHGDFYTCSDRYNPGTLQGHKWENAMTIDKQSWGFRRNALLSDYLTTHELIVTLAETVSCGGNILINVGPTKDGIIAPIYEDRLLGLGAWLEINGEAIYDTTPWVAQNDSITKNVWYTKKGPIVYVIVLDWPENNLIHLGSIVQNGLIIDSISMLGIDNDLVYEANDEVLFVYFPDKALVKSNEAWVLKIETDVRKVQIL